MEDYGRPLPLHLAAKSGNYSEICSLFEGDSETDINAEDEMLFTPIHYAVLNGHADIVKFLIEKRADINKKNYLGHTPIDVAATNGNTEIVRILFEAGAVCRYTGVSPEFSTLHLAAQEGRIEVIKYFLDLGGDVDFRTGSGFTLLHIAARFGRIGLVAFLLERGANVNNRTHHKGYTPLHFAVTGDWPEVVDVLIQEGANFEIEDNQKFSPVHLIFLDDFSKDGSKALVKHVLLRNRNYWSNVPVNYRFVRGMGGFWHDCQIEIDRMSHCIIGNTCISLYKFLRDILDDNKLVTYLGNDEIRQELEMPESYFVQFPLYSNFSNIIRKRIRKGMVRKQLFDRAGVVMHKIMPRLPMESTFEICSYLSNNDLVNFTKSFNDCLVENR